MHNRGRLQDLLRINGVVIRHVGLEAPFQLGRGERQGGLLKDLMKTTMEEKQIIGVREMQMLVAETVMVKNCRLNQHGFTPIQWVLGRMPTDRTSLTDEGADGPHLGVHEEVQNPEDVFSKQLEIRQAAKMAFARVDSTRRVRAALLRKSFFERSLQHWRSHLLLSEREVDGTSSSRGQRRSKLESVRDHLIEMEPTFLFPVEVMR